MKWTKTMGILIFLSVASCDRNSGSNTDVHSDTLQTSYLGYQSRFVEVNGLSFHLIEAGEGEVLLFLHGFPYFAESWHKLLQPLSKKYQVVAPDNRGYGYTEKPRDLSDYKIDKLVEDVHQLISRLSPHNKVTIIGHDWGGVLAWSVAQVHPQLVKSLVVINAPPFNVFLGVLEKSPSQREASRYIGKLDGWIARLLFAIRGPELIWRGMSHLQDEGHVDGKFKEAFMAAWQQPKAAESAINWYKANIPGFDAISEQDYWPSKNARVTVPSLLIWSKHDKAFTADTFRAIPPFVDELIIKQIHTDSHAPFLDHTQEILGYIEAFLHEN